MKVMLVIISATIGMAIGLLIGLAVPIVGGLALDALTEPTSSGQPQSMMMLLVLPFSLLGGLSLGGGVGISWALRKPAR